MNDDLAETMERLRNWANWAKDKPHYRVTQSLEGRYKPPPVWEAPQPTTFIDINDALKLERAIIGLSKFYKTMIVYCMIRKYLPMREYFRKNKLAILERDFPELEKKAYIMVKNRLKI